MIYVTSDLHGYPLEKFQALLKKANFSQRDYCFVLGDVIDRGPDGVKLLLWLMMQPNISLILGNHEAMLLSCSFIFDLARGNSMDDLSQEDTALLHTWLRNGGGPTLEALGDCDQDTILMIEDYLRDAPLYDMVKAGGRTFLLVHGGLKNFDPLRDLDDYSLHDLLWTRPELSDTYFQTITTILGHTPTHYYGPQYTGKALITPTWINIDTGAASGQAPMLLRLNDLQEFYAD